MSAALVEMFAVWVLRSEIDDVSVPKMPGLEATGRTQECTIRWVVGAVVHETHGQHADLRTSRRNTAHCSQEEDRSMEDTFLEVL